MASLVDPHFKMTHIKEEKVEYSAMKTRAMSELEDLVAEQMEAVAATDEHEICAKRHKKSLTSFLKK